MRNKGRGIVAEYIRRYDASMKWMIAALRGKQAEAAQDADATIKNRYRRPAPTVFPSIEDFRHVARQLE
jgi:hypothetical protein